MLRFEYQQKDAKGVGMPPVLQDEKVGRFQDMVGSSVRMGVSEFARSKSWRETLPDAGCFEVVDRGGVVGYMIAPEYAVALADRIADLEALLEREQIAAMFNSRSNRTDVKAGSDLTSAALECFERNASALRGAIYGD